MLHRSHVTRSKNSWLCQAKLMFGWFLEAQRVDTADLNLVGGWPTPLKNMNVNWDDDIPIHSQYMEKYKMFQTTNQELAVELLEHLLLSLTGELSISVTYSRRWDGFA